MKKNFIFFCLVTSLLTVTPTVQSFQWSSKSTIFATTVAVLAPYMYKCCTKEDPLTRYDLDELFAGNDILKNLYYLYIDGFLGTPEKGESFKMKGKDDGKMSFKAKPKREATGVVGTIHANIKNALKISTLLATIWAIINYEQLSPRLIYKLGKNPALGIDLLEDMR